jgi:ribosome-associated translation inhibitor RaiA
MRIEIRGRHLAVTLELRLHGERSIGLAMARFSDRIQRVTIDVLDRSGLRGGVDKCCRIVVRLRPTGVVFLEEADGDLYVALDRAAGRAGRAVARRLHHGWRFSEQRRKGDLIALRPGRVVVPDRLSPEMELAPATEAATTKEVPQW